MWGSYSVQAIGSLQVEFLAEDVVCEAVCFMWQKRSWSQSNEEAGLKTDFMTIFIGVRPCMPLFPVTGSLQSAIRLSPKRIITCFKVSWAF